MTETRYFKESGPLTLEHDCSMASAEKASPRDLHHSLVLTEAPTYRTDFRYQGYPGNSFLSPRQRLGQQVAELQKHSPKPSLFHPAEHSGRRDGLAEVKQADGQEAQYQSEMPAPPTPSKIYVHHTKGMPLGERRTSAEIRKIQEQRLMAEKDIQLFKDEQRRKKLKELEEKKQDFEMLKGFDMMDKKFGGGAPKGDGDNRKRKFTEQDVTPRPELKYRDPMNPVMKVNRSMLGKNKDGDFILDNFGRPGNGAPLVTDSGEIKADLQGDASIRYNDGGRASIENRLRYRPVQPTKKEDPLERQRENEQKELEIQTARIKELRQELELLRQSEEFGKLSGGATQNLQSDSFASRAELDSYKPSNKGQGRPKRSSLGSVKKIDEPSDSRHNMKEAIDPPFRGWAGTSPDLVLPHQESKSLDLERSRGGAGAPQLDQTGRPKTRFPITMHRDDYGATKSESSVSQTDEVLPGHRRRITADHEHEEYYPFGRPGGGAPMVDKQGNVKTSLNGSLTKEKSSADIRRKQRAARDLLKELNQEMIDQKRNRDDFEKYLKQPDKDLAELMKQGLVGHPKRDPDSGALLPQHLASSDVSKQELANLPYRGWAGTSPDLVFPFQHQKMSLHFDHTKVAQRKYHDELEIQANERMRNRELEKLKQKQEEEHHCDVFAGQFRRYGGGAPKGPYTQKKENLAQLLYTPRREDRVAPKAPWDSNENSQYRKAYEENRLYPVGHFAKSTIRSTHANQFEVPANTTKGNYNPPAPYATNTY